MSALTPDQSRESTDKNSRVFASSNINDDQIWTTRFIPSSTYNESTSQTSSSGSDPIRSVTPPESNQGNERRHRTISGIKIEDHLLTTESGLRVYTKGRPPWYDQTGRNLKEPYMICICGGSASGKTTVARRIIDQLEMPWVTVLSMDSFYKVLNEEQHKRAQRNEYNFDHPDAFDFDLLIESLQRLRDGKSVEVPVYDFGTHRRDKQPKVIYGADVLIFEGILGFHHPDIVSMMDMRIFVDTDSDTRLARRLDRDISERARDVSGVLQQYIQHVKPSFDNFIAPRMKLAHIIIPRGGENQVVIDLLVKQIKTRLADRGYDASEYAPHRLKSLFGGVSCTLSPLPANLTLVEQTPQVRGLLTFIRNKDTSRDEFIFYSERLMRILIENAMNEMPFEDVIVNSPNGTKYDGRRNSCRDEICGVSMMRAGETMEHALRAVVKDCKMGKMLIQTNGRTLEPELHYLRLPTDVHIRRILLLDATMSTGAAAIMAVRILLDHDVPEQHIILAALLMTEPGVQSLAYSFPGVKLLTTAIDRSLDTRFRALPGVGSFADRYYGTERTVNQDDSDDD